MVKPCVYIDYPFFKLLLKKGAASSNPLLRTTKRQYNLLMDFLFDSGIDLVCHIDDDEPDDYDLIRVLEDYHVQGKVVLRKLDKEIFSDQLKKIGENTPFNLCFLAAPEKCQKEIIESSGYQCISNETFDDFMDLAYLKKNSFEVAKDGDIAGWSDFSKLSHEFNTIVFFDSYLFAKQTKKTRSQYTETVSEIISKMLVQNKCKTIHILIAFPKLQPNQEIQESIDVLKNKLEKSIESKLNGSKEIFVGLTKISQKSSINHDRLIFTNFMVLFSGDSFNYFQHGQQPNIETVLTSHSILDWQNNFQTYLKKLKKLKKVMPSIDKLGYETVRTGKCDLSFLNHF